MADNTQNIPYFFHSDKKNLLDIMDTYKYMNSSMLSELFMEGIWDHGTGWAQLHYSPNEWRQRHSESLPSPYPEAPTY